MRDISYHAHQTAPVASRPFDLRRLLLLAVVPLPILAAFAPGLFVDPILGPAAGAALFRDADAAHAEALLNGHWMLWIWSARTWPQDLETLIMLFYGGWAVYCAGLAQAIFRHDGSPTRAMLLAIALALAPPLADISIVLPAAVPTILLLVGHLLAVLLLPVRLGTGLLLVVTPLFMITDASLVMMALATHVIVVGTGRDGARPTLTTSLVLFLFGVAIGILAIFLLNQWQHGVFGLEKPIAAPLAEGEDRLALIGEWIAEFGHSLLGSLAPFGPIMVVASFVILFWCASGHADRLFGTLVLGLLVIFGETVISGRAPLPQALLFVWVMVVVVLGTAAAWSPVRLLSILLVIGLVVSAAIGGVWWQARYANSDALRAGSAAMVSDLAGSLEDPPRLIAIAGSPSSIEGGEALREFEQLAFRVHQLTGIPTVQCPTPHPVCRERGGELAQMPARPAEGWIRRSEDGILLLRLPDGVFVPAPRS
ncbi:MAG: hypothetical protein AAFR79_16150 [Pseudomonadota bacterium]